MDEARAILEEARALGRTLLLPMDSTCAASLDDPGSACVIEGDLPEDLMGLDIGPASAGAAAEILRDAKTVIWNGPMGVFETPPFDAGSRAVADAVVDATGRGAISVIGGGETAAAIEAFGHAEAVSHVSTGGGASLQMLEGRSFRSVELLEEA